MSPSLSMSPNAAPRLTSDSPEDLSGLLGDLDVAPVDVAVELVDLVERVGVALLHEMLERLDLAIEHDHVEQTVVVDVEPAGAEAGVVPARCRQTVFESPVLEEAAAVVDEERVGLAEQVGS